METEGSKVGSNEFKKYIYLDGKLQLSLFFPQVPLTQIEKDICIYETTHITIDDDANWLCWQHSSNNLFVHICVDKIATIWYSELIPARHSRLSPVDRSMWLMVYVLWMKILSSFHA